MSHEEEVAELCPVGDALPIAGSCILPSAKATRSGPGLGVCLDFAFVRWGPSLECQVLSTLPGFPLETKVGMKCQMFAAALGWHSLPKPSARPGRMHRAALGNSVLNSQCWDSKLLSAPGCVHTPVCLSGTQGCPVVSGLRGNSLVLD